jgi:glycosyltransferase involved in cell wall biosynthesis
MLWGGVLRVAVFHNIPSGGAKRALFGFVRYLKQSGHLVDVFTPGIPDESYLPLDSVADSVRVFDVRRTVFGNSYSRLKYVPGKEVRLPDLDACEREIAGEINDGGYDVLFSEQDVFMYSPFLLRHVRIPVVYYCQQPNNYHRDILRGVSGQNACQRMRWNSYWEYREHRIDRYNASFASTILVNSQYMREVVRQYYGLDCVVSYLGVDTERFRPLDVGDEGYVLSVGRCCQVKGFDFIIRSLGLLDSSVRPDLILVSDEVDPEWMAFLRGLAEDKGVNVEFRRMVSDDELIGLYNRARLFLYASFREPFGLVPLESMACGTPVAAAGVGGFSESIVHGKTGVLTGRVESEFSEAVGSLLKDDSRLGSMGAQALKSVNGFWTVGHAGERLVNHLRDTIGVGVD